MYMIKIDVEIVADPNDRSWALVQQSGGMVIAFLSHEEANNPENAAEV